MLIHIDDKKYEINEDLISSVCNNSFRDMKEKYGKLDMRTRLGIKTMVRSFVFPFLEKLLKQPVRPPKEEDPLMFLIHQFILIIEDVAKHASFNIKTSEFDGSTHRPTSIKLTIQNPSESGRQLDFSWEEGIRKDHIRKKIAS